MECCGKIVIELRRERSDKCDGGGHTLPLTDSAAALRASTDTPFAEFTRLGNFRAVRNCLILDAFSDTHFCWRSQLVCEHADGDAPCDSSGDAQKVSGVASRVRGGAFVVKGGVFYVTSESCGVQGDACYDKADALIVRGDSHGVRGDEEKELVAKS